MRTALNTPQPAPQATSPFVLMGRALRELVAPEPRESIREISEACNESLRRSRQRRGLES